MKFNKQKLFFAVLTVFLSEAHSACIRPTVYFKPTVTVGAGCSSGSSSTIVVSSSGGGARTYSLCANQARTLKIEGSGKVIDSTRGETFVVNALGGNRFMRLSATEAARCPYGYGVRQICLDPFHSVAADLRVFKPGEVLFIPALVGLTIPSGPSAGRPHQGFVIVRDTGPRSHIHDNRLDFFTGDLSDRHAQNTMARLGFANANKCFSYRKATAAETAQVKSKRRYPNL